MATAQNSNLRNEIVTHTSPQDDDAPIKPGTWSPKKLTQAEWEAAVYDMAKAKIIPGAVADKLVMRSRQAKAANNTTPREDPVERLRIERRERIKVQAFSDARIPPHFRHANFDTTEFGTPLTVDPSGNGKALKWTRHLSENWTKGHKGLTLEGPSGTGKTYMAMATLCSLIRQHGSAINARYITEQELLRYFRDSFGRGEYDAEKPSTMQVRLWFVERPEFLVLDDLGAEPVSGRGDWARGQVMELLEHRWRHQKTTFVTTNLPERELVNRYDDRIASRLYGYSPLIPVTIDADFRQQVRPDSDDPFWDPRFDDEGRPKATH